MHRDPQASKACLEHSPFLKVNVTGRLATTQPAATHHGSPRAWANEPDGRLTGGEKPGIGTVGDVLRHRCYRPELRSNYELFNRSNINIRYWSWSYRGCWHQTCPPMDPRERI